MPSPDLKSLLQSTFGFASFRANQQTVCETSAAGRDVLLVMPTGAGKSLCYQLPALARGGTGLVISPLIALMEDQAGKLASLGLRVGRIHSGMDREHSRQVCREYLDGSLQFLFIAPERLKVPGFVDMLRKRTLALIAVDEAHCISQWGHDFRPDYRNLARHIEALRPAPVIALTATATPQVQRDIVSELKLQDAMQFIHGFRRTNLAIEVVEVSRPRRKEMARKLLSEAESRPAIVYAPSRKDAEELASELNHHFPTAAYHAGLPPATREAVQHDFLRGKTQVVVATVAFGMGIDKADVRTVLHSAMPASVESYYQEIGRAGRDGKPSRAVLMYSFQDRRMHDFFLERDYPPADTLARVAARLGNDPVHADDLRIALKLDLDTFTPALDKLLAQGAAEIDFAGNVTGTATTRNAWRSSYESQVSFRRGQIDAMMRFANGAECRMAALIRHFGDQSDGSRTCGLCDFCSPERAVAQPFREPSSDELREMRRVLRELSKVSNKSTGKLHSELFPKQQMDRKEFDSLLDALSRAGYIAIESATFTAEDGRDIPYRKAVITHEGRDVEDGADLVGVQLRDAEMSNAGRSSRERIGGSSKGERRAARETETEEMQPLTSAQKQMEAAIKTWRRQTAAELKQPAFCIFGDKVLRSIAIEHPRTLSDLMEIKGLGKVKVERWGDALCNILADAGNVLETIQAGVPSTKSAPSRPRNEHRTPSKSTATVQASSLPQIGAAPEASAARSATSSTLLAAAPSLEHALKIWRMHEAKRQSLAPFVLLLDSTVRAIAQAQPSTVNELRKLPGITDEWAEIFGDALCDLVRQHTSPQNRAAQPSRNVLQWPENSVNSA